MNSYIVTAEKYCRHEDEWITYYLVGLVEDEEFGLSEDWDTDRLKAALFTRMGAETIRFLLKDRDMYESYYAEEMHGADGPSNKYSVEELEDVPDDLSFLYEKVYLKRTVQRHTIDVETAEGLEYHTCFGGTSYWEGDKFGFLFQEPKPVLIERQEAEGIIFHELRELAEYTDYYTYEIVDSVE